MSYIRRDVIEAKATELRTQAGLRGIPVPVERIARKQGISVKFETLSDDISGALIRKGDVAIIAVNVNHSPVRKVFTLAHELGHYVLHQSDEVFLDKVVMRRDAISARGDDFKEIQANQFAASLLMPKAELEEFFDAQCKVNQDQEDIVSNLAKQFGVSSRAMELRLVNLALISFGEDE
jgi:Zn-dependent peptidase ImmA (M78 family)